MTVEPVRRVRESVVDEGTQQRFATWSGDHNPLHVDVSAARRSSFGGPVVHGVHLVLQLLDLASDVRPSGAQHRLDRLDVEFRRHVPVETPFTLEVTVRPDGDGSAGTGEVRRGSMVCTRVRWRSSEDSHTPAAGSDTTWPSAPHGTPPPGDPCTGPQPVHLDREPLGELLPHLARELALTDIAVLLAATRTVGMRCPGELALLRQLSLRRSEEVAAREPLQLRVIRRDPRMSLIVLELIGAGRRIEIQALERPSPVAQAPLSAARALVRQDRFSGARVAVIGGSRGLGEVAVKLLVAGGASCIVSSRQAGPESPSLHDPLGAASLVLDVRAPSEAALHALRDFAPTHLAYFAAPALTPLAEDDEYGRALLQSVLVDGLRPLLAAAAQGRALIGLLVPSTSFADDPPPGLEVYAGIKRHLEDQMRVLRIQRPELRIIVPRLPPLLTDQTVGNVTTGTDRTLQVILETLEDLLPDHRLRVTAPQDHHHLGLKSLAGRSLGSDPHQASGHHLHWLWRANPASRGPADSLIAERHGRVVGMVHKVRLPWHGADGTSVDVAAVVDLAVEHGEPPGTALALLRSAMQGEARTYIPASRTLGPGLARLGGIEVPSTWWRRTLLPRTTRGLRWSGGAQDPMRLRDLVDSLHGSERDGLHVTTRLGPAHLQELSVLLAAGTAVAFSPALVAWRLFHRYGPPSAWLHHVGTADQGRADLIVAFGVRHRIPFVRLVSALGTEDAIAPAVSGLTRSAAAWGAALLLATVPPDLGPAMRSAGLHQLPDAPTAWLMGGAPLAGPVRYDGLLGDLGLDGIPRDTGVRRRRTR